VEFSEVLSNYVRGLKTVRTRVLTCVHSGLWSLRIDAEDCGSWWISDGASFWIRIAIVSYY
jgi:hypothetical protein